MGSSFARQSYAVLHRDDLCHSYYCRNEVAGELGGETRFVMDTNGIKWKCVPRRGISSEPGKTGEGWACAELDCRRGAGGTVANSFHYGKACMEPWHVCTVDAALVKDAPRASEEYLPVESLGKPESTMCTDDSNAEAEGLLQIRTSSMEGLALNGWLWRVPQRTASWSDFL
mmetsp:Transcript_17662/g.40916  ORF Transcript_17662/g.40916 Transcript_17662/m.40916 type:complete len:172 (-) Transcript_17662:11-526(-)